MPHPFFDAPAYPWHRPDAIELHRQLYVAINQPPQITLRYAQSSQGLLPLAPGAADLMWREALDSLTTARVLRRFCENIIADANLAAIHPAVVAVQDAPDPLQATLLGQGRIFVDRTRLRSELQKLSSQNSGYGVLLVRGASGSGKSWTKELIVDYADQPPLQCLCLYDGLVGNVDEVVEQLFAMLGESAAVPPRLETDEAWFRKVCVTLLGVAQRKQVVSWVVADDLGDYPEGPRLDPDIRRFFNQFALSMGNPVFARWFRLVLLDYPDGQVPTKWRNFWVEDRPKEEDVTEAPLTEFLIKWAAAHEKQIGSDTAKIFATDILVKVAAPLPPGDARPRLRRIHEELMQVLQTL